MPALSLHELSNYIEKVRASGTFPGTTLIFGEELRCHDALDRIKHVLLPDPKSKSGFEPMDGAPEAIGDVIERVNTYALFGRRKVVAVLDSRIFYARRDMGKISEKISSAVKRQDLGGAFRFLMQLATLLGVGLEDLSAELRDRLEEEIRSALPEDTVLDTVLDYGRSLTELGKNGSSEDGSALADPAEMLERAILKGFPKENFLILTTDVVDKRKKLYKAMETQGLVVDCSVPTGNRTADQKAQEALFFETVHTKMAKQGKRLNPAAMAALREKIGFNLRLLVGSLDKLVDYVGQRREITAPDVDAVLVRTREDPIYALTDAVSNRQTALSLDYLDSLLNSGYHPLQILSALTNQFRKILVIKDFMENRCPGLWRSGCVYASFQQQILPHVIQADAALTDMLQSWEKRLSEDSGQGEAPHGRKASRNAKIKVSADLVMAKNPKSAFPLFQLFRKAEHFTLPALMTILSALSEADGTLKSTGADPRHVLERLIFSIPGSES